MAIAIRKVPDTFDVWGRTTVQPVDLTLDSSYPVAGYVVNAQDIGLKYITGALVVGINTVGQSLIVNINLGASFNTNPPQASVNVTVLYPTGGATASPAALANPIVTTGVASATTVDATQPNITPGRGKLVAAATDLSTVQVRVIFFGL